MTPCNCGDETGGIATRPYATALVFTPDTIQATRSDNYTPGLPLILPNAYSQGPATSFIQPWNNLNGHMPGNGWFPYAVASAPFDAIPPGPTRGNVMNKLGGGSTRWSGASIRAWLKENLLGQAGP